MGNSVFMLDPAGKVREIPSAQKDAALRAGGKIAVKMLDPKGTQRWIPESQTEDAIKAGGKKVDSNGVQDLLPSKDNTEGLYAMYGRTGKGEEVGERQIPYSKVQNALLSGYTFYGDESSKQYANDKEAEGKEPSFLGKVDENIKNILTPEKNTGNKSARTDINNTLRAAGRVVYGAPEYLKEVANAAKDSLETHNTNELLDLIDPTMLPKNLYDQFQSDWKHDKRLAVQNLIGSIGGMAIVERASHGAGKVGEKVAEKTSQVVHDAPDHARGFVQSITRTGPTVMRKLIDDTQKENEEKFKEYEDARADSDRQHQINMSRRKAEEESDVRNTDSEHNKKVDAVKAANDEVINKWKKEADEINATNEKAKGEIESRRKLEEELNRKTDAYYAEEEKRDLQAKKEENEAWKPWREKVKGLFVDIKEIGKKVKAIGEKNPEVARFIRDLPDDVGDVDPNSRFAIDREGIVKGQGYTKPYSELPDEARERIDDLVNRMGLKPEAKDFDFEKDEMTIEDLHRAKSILGLKLAKGDYEGFVRGEMEKLYDLLRNEEASASVRAGASDELIKAQEATKKYHDTFGRKRRAKETKRTEREKLANPERYKEREEERRLATTSRHYPELADANKEISDLRGKLKAMPKEETLSKQIKPIPEVPKLKPYPEKEAKTVNKIDTVKYPKVPTKKSVGAEELSAANKEKYRDFLEKLPQRATYVLATLPAIRIASALTHLKFGQALIDMIYVSTAAPFAVAGLNKIADLIGKNDDITKWITEPTTEDLVKLNRLLPPEDQQVIAEGLRKVVVAAKKKGIKVSPLIAAFIASHKPIKKDQEVEEEDPEEVEQ